MRELVSASPLSSMMLSSLWPSIITGAESVAWPSLSKAHSGPGWEAAGRAVGRDPHLHPLPAGSSGAGDGRRHRARPTRRAAPRAVWFSCPTLDERGERGTAPGRVTNGVKQRWGGVDLLSRRGGEQGWVQQQRGTARAAPALAPLSLLPRPPAQQ